MAKTTGPSEFEPIGPNKTGIFGLANAWEKLRLIYRTGQAEDPAPNVDAAPDDWGTGGLRDPNDRIV